jgi:hypothetical protein
MDLEHIHGLPARRFALVFASNVLEHLADVSAFLRAAWRLLAAEGSLLVAVPPITGADARAVDLKNPYHLNSWSPTQWHHVLGLYFGAIDCYRHGTAALIGGRQPLSPAVDESDFVFEPIPLADFYRLPTIGAVFVARQPRPANDLPAFGALVPFVDQSFSRPLSRVQLLSCRLRAELRAELRRAVRAALPSTWSDYLARQYRRLRAH